MDIHAPAASCCACESDTQRDASPHPTATAVCRNFQVIHLAGAQGNMCFAHETHEDYLTALTRLKELPFFDSVESFNESLLGLQHSFANTSGEIDLAITIENASLERLRTLDDQDATARVWPASVFGRQRGSE